VRVRSGHAVSMRTYRLNFSVLLGVLRRFTQWAAFAVVAMALLIMNLRLVSKNRELRTLADSYRSDLETPLHVPLGPLQGVGLAGQEVTIQYTPPRRTILLVLSPQCKFCDENWPAWYDLLRRARGRANIVIVDVSSTVTGAYLEAHGITGLPVVRHLSKDSVQTYNLRFSPSTIVMAPNGLAEYAFSGVLSQKAIDVVFRYLQ